MKDLQHPISPFKNIVPPKYKAYRHIITEIPACLQIPESRADSPLVNDAEPAGAPRAPERHEVGRKLENSSARPAVSSGAPSRPFLISRRPTDHLPAGGMRQQLLTPVAVTLGALGTLAASFYPALCSLRFRTNYFDFLSLLWNYVYANIYC